MNRTEMIIENYNLIHHCLKDFILDEYTSVSSYDYEDWEQVGAEGLIRAVDTYDISLSKFSTYACNCIKKEILKKLKNFNADKRKSNKNTADLNDWIKVPQKKDMEYSSLDKVCVRKGISSVLNGELHTLVYEFYINGYTYDEIAEKYNLTHSQVKNGLIRASKLLRKYFKKEGVLIA